MQEKVLLVADSGSTKTDWCLVSKGKKKNFSTQGINPYFLEPEAIVEILQQEIPAAAKKVKVDEVHFYGAGLGEVVMQKKMATTLRAFFKTKKVTCNSDMLAAARATCSNQKGIVCILGTGSNTCYFDGKKMAFKTPSLGYVLGDEGGGTYLGKKLLQYYLHDILDPELKKEFEKDFRNELTDVLGSVYSKPLPNRYLAQFATFIFSHRGHYMIENIAEDGLNDVFLHHLLRYPKVHKLPVHFTGSIAFFLKDILRNLCDQYEIEMGTVLQKPMAGLIRFHSA